MRYTFSCVVPTATHATWVAPNKSIARGIAARLDALLKERGESQTDLANATGITKGAISKYIDARIIPGGDRLIRICQHFGVTADWLLGLSTNRHPSAPADAVAVVDEKAISEFRQAGWTREQFLVMPLSTRYRAVTAAELDRILADDRIRKAMDAGEDPPRLA